MSLRISIIIFLSCLGSGCMRWELSCNRCRWDGELEEMARSAARQRSAEDPALSGFDYREGWCAGYENILRGGTGEPPLAPPSEYFDPFLRRPQQANRVNLWHDGFVAGAAFAREMCMERYAELPAKSAKSDVGLSLPYYSVERVCGTKLTPTDAAGERPLPKPLAPPSLSKQPSEKLDDDDGTKSSPERLPAPSSRSDREGDPGASAASEDDLTASFRRLEQAAVAMQKSVLGLPKAPARETVLPADEVAIAKVSDQETATPR